VTHFVGLLGLWYPNSYNVSSDSITFKINIFLVLLIAIDLHELGHALVADWLGDDTPRLAGQMTLNPFRKMDQFGIVMLVLLSLFGAGFTYGFTPINENKLRQRVEFGPAIVALAGPLVNLAIAVICAVVLNAGTSIVYDSSGAGGVGLFGSMQVFDFVNLMMYYNLVLFVLNLIPLPPLDGWTILSGFFTAKTQYELRTFVMYGPYILLLLFIFNPYIHVLDNTLYPIVNSLEQLLSNL
jgi:Zn-dependent protease